MGVTGLAFRTRWFWRPKEERWNGSGPIGEGEESFEAVRKATGWELASPIEGRENRDPERLRAAVVAAIDSGQAVVSYGDQRDLGVIHGYEDGGKTLLAYDYYHQGETVRLAPDKVVDPGILVPGKRGEALSPKAALLAALSLAVKNWSRAPEGAGERRYWYGASALDRWADDLAKAGDLSDVDRKKLFDASWWTLDCLNDARLAGATYVRQNAQLLGPEARAALDRAAGLLDQEVQATAVTFVRKDVFLGPWTGKTVADWTPEVRRNEVLILEKSRRIEARVIEGFREALKAEGAGR
jgi:hypothetical protein